MKCKLKFLGVLFAYLISFHAYAESDEKIFLDFRNQKISDIIYALADICEESVFVDETVIGNATFHFEDKNFSSALNRFADYCHLYVIYDNGVYKVSKISLNIVSKEKLSLNTEDVPIEPLLNVLSRNCNATILYDSLPVTNITIRVSDESLENILNLIIVKLPGYVLERVASGYYITRSSANSTRKNVDVFTISAVNDTYSLSIQKGNFINIIDTLFGKAGKEYSLLSKPNIQLENIVYSDKSFDEILLLLLEQASSDYVVENNIYRIFEVQKRDITKKYKNTEVVQLKNISTDTLLQLLPSDLNNSAFIKIDKVNGTVILFGSSFEIDPIISFINQVDVPSTGRKYKQFDIANLTVKEAVSLIPKSLLISDPIILPSNKGFVTLVTDENEKPLEDFIKVIDNLRENYAITLKYIKSDELLNSLPIGVSKENITLTNDPALIFFSGNQNQYDAFCNDLTVIDHPKQQIKYQLLVIQRQKTNGINWSTSLSSNSSDAESGYAWSGMLSNIFNINFDIISQFGVQFAGNLNAELSEGKSHVLADTTLNGISGESISFSNTNTYRYRDIVVNPSGDMYTSTAREIASGLILNINGWVSGDDMITVKIEAQVSKQGSTSSSSTDTTNPPSTSEKKVSTNVRTRSGEPVIIGGLFQQEIDITEKKVPFLGSIPLLGNLFKSRTESVAETEFIIYLVPFVEKDNSEVLSEDENLNRLMNKYKLD